MTLLQSNEVTVSTLPHPISMFLLGIFLVAIIYMLSEIHRFRQENEKIKQFGIDFDRKISDLKSESDSKIADISKKIDSRVDKALLSFKKQNKNQE